MNTLPLIGGSVPDRAFEIIVDNFAGGGGASTGFELALGRSPDVAVNHDPEAVLMHKFNHPDCKHFCKSVWEVSPTEIARLGPIGAAWFSPDCKHFSKAKGGKPREKSVRDLAWIVHAWARLPKHIRPRVIFLENVEEFKTWGPLDADNRPIKERAGEDFEKWKGQLQTLGYKIEWREIRACDYGAPTIRKRLFLIARCDRRPIVWPEPTHGKPDDPRVIAGEMLPYRTAADIIDWSIPCASIFDRKRPLAHNTMQRTAAGIWRYVLNTPTPFIVKANHGGNGFRGQAIDQPLQTVTQKNGYGIAVPYISRHFGNSIGHAATAPLGTTTSGGAGKSQLIAPFLTKFRTGAIGSSTLTPTPTITASSWIKRPGGGQPLGIIAPVLTKHYGGVVGHEITKPTGTITTVDHHAVTAPVLVKYYGNDKDGQGINTPAHTVTAKDRLALSAACLTHFYSSAADGGNGNLRHPAKTVTAGGIHHGLITTDLAADFARFQDQRVKRVASFLIKYLAKDFRQWSQLVDRFTPTPSRWPTHWGAVTVMTDGETYTITDVGMRMLDPRELFNAQGFPADYEIECEIDGRKLPKHAQVRMCGNSVSPPPAAALIAANVHELATNKTHQAAE